MSSTTSQRRCDDLATLLETGAKILRDHGAEAFELAADWEGHLAATASEPGSRSTEHNDLSRRITRTAPQFVGAHERMITMFKVAQVFVDDLAFCHRAERTRREETNRLDRINSRNGECEICYEAGEADSYQSGTLERIVLVTTTTVDGQPDHDQIDVCRACAKSGHGSRASARSKGETWDPDGWRRERVEVKRRMLAVDNIGAGVSAS